jgi:hypothetical protein
LIHQFWTENNKGEIQTLPCGSTRMIVIGKLLWIDKKYLKLVEAYRPTYMPRIVKVQAFPWLNIRVLHSVDSPVAGRISNGQMVRVHQSFSDSSGEWGRVDGGWINLGYTNWKAGP